MNTSFSTWSAKRVKLFFISCFLLLISCNSIAQDSQEWPKELKSERGTIVLYQPQPEKLQGNLLTARAAMSLEYNGNSTPVFGVFWFSSTLETDRSTDSVTFSNIRITKVGWPDQKEDDEKKFTDFVEAQLGNSNFSGSLSKLTATLATVDKVQESLKDIKNDAPTIIFKEELAILLSYDGDPIFSDIEDSTYLRALNTSFAVVQVKNKQEYYLTDGSTWFKAANELGPWNVTAYPPSDLVNMIAKGLADVEIEETVKQEETPRVVTVTNPTELVVSDGKPEWVSLTGGKLLYVKNTETPWLREIATGDMYLLLSGRWFKSQKQAGPWVFVRGDKLPESFQDIPPESDIGGFRTSIAGTDEAEQAVLDAQIPQTAAIKRSEASLVVDYDGEPKFVLIEGTEVEYAVNTSSQVLRIEGKYYAVENGVWFFAPNATGTWRVADTIPTAAIAQIPPSSPMYNTTYVTVYSSTPEVVYVGYTSGYLWSYPYYGVPIYGTGWYYPPYYGRWYYPRPTTWGLHVGYNPWTGWNVGVSWGSPYFRVGVVWGGGYHRHYKRCCGRYHGHYRPRGVGGVHIRQSSIIKRPHATPANSRGKYANTGKRKNLYNQGNNKARNMQKATPSRNNQAGRSTSSRSNNVYADKKGNVVRHQNGQWQSRSNNDWKTNSPQSAGNRSTSTKNKAQTRNNSTGARSQQQNRSSSQSRSQNHTMNRDLKGRNMGSRNTGNIQRGRR